MDLKGHTHYQGGINAHFGSFKLATSKHVLFKLKDNQKILKAEERNPKYLKRESLLYLLEVKIQGFGTRNEMSTFA